MSLFSVWCARGQLVGFAPAAYPLFPEFPSSGLELAYIVGHGVELVHQVLDGDTKSNSFLVLELVVKTIFLLNAVNFSECCFRL